MEISNSSDTDSSVIAFANVYQFGRGQRIRHPRVESRMFLWCKGGLGRVTVNGKLHQFAAGDYLFLPWGHEVLYEADGKEPMFVGGIHIIPFQRRGSVVKFEVSHRPDDSLAGLKARKDVFWPQLEGLVGGMLDEGRLTWLASYIVDLHHNTGPDERTMRDLARLLVREIALDVTSRNSAGQPVPAALRRIQEYIRSHPGGDLGVDALAAVAECSAVSVHRLFRRFLGVTPHGYVAGERVRTAKRLLQTTALPIGRVGEIAGFEDPFHFSRFFSRETGVSPREYRKRVAQW